MVWKCAVWVEFIQYSLMFNEFFIDIENILYEAKVREWGPRTYVTFGLLIVMEHERKETVCNIIYCKYKGYKG